MADILKSLGSGSACSTTPALKNIRNTYNDVPSAQIVATGLQLQTLGDNPTTTNALDNCIGPANPDGANCNQDFGGASYPCLSADFPSCMDFVQGKKWSQCHSKCESFPIN